MPTKHIRCTCEGGGIYRCRVCKQSRRLHDLTTLDGEPVCEWGARRQKPGKLEPFHGSNKRGWICDPCWRAGLKGRRSGLSRDLRLEVIARDGLVCQICGIAVRLFDGVHAPDTLHIDHIKPWAEGGSHDLENLRVTCARCNLTRPKPQSSRKPHKTRKKFSWKEWRESWDVWRESPEGQRHAEWVRKTLGPVSIRAEEHPWLDHP